MESEQGLQDGPLRASAVVECLEEIQPQGTQRYAEDKQKEAELQDEALWGAKTGQLETFARNVSVDYLTMAIQMAIGVLMLPFNVSRLGQSEYGLLVLATSITVYFSLLDFGYGVAQVKFAAEYRARRDREGLNQIASTLFFLFSIVGLVVFGVGTLIAFNLETFFNITHEQAATGRAVLMLVSAYVALGFPFSVFGGVVNGFQRHYVNGGVAIATTIVVALVNVAVLLAGYGLVELVAATTAVRILSYFGYRLNAYRAFPGLRISPRYFRLSRLREVTGFSIFLLVIDLANKLNYSADTVVIGAFMSTVAISIWAVAQRLAETAQNLTSQMNAALFPIVVDIATLGEADRLRRVLVQGTRLSLAMVIPICTGLVMLSDALVRAWVGPQFAGSVPIIYVLALAVTIRVGNSMATTLLKGAGGHRLLAISNSTAAVLNLVLSIALVKRFGLAGVALGTLVPLGLVSIFVLFPAACRRVQLPLRSAIGQAILPTLWPMIPMMIFLAVTRSLVTSGLVYVALQSILAGCLYALLFLRFAIGTEEREWYETKVRQLIKRPREAAVV